MIETNYDYDSAYHEGSVTVQDALAFLGVYKRIEDVPDMFHLSNFATDVDADKAWDAFCEDKLANISQHTRDTVYGAAYRRWSDYCHRHDVNPALADPEDIEGWLIEEVTATDSTMKTTHDIRFRPIFRWYRWMAFHTEYPHRYQPTVMAVLLGGATHDIWRTRMWDRTNNPRENND